QEASPRLTPRDRDAPRKSDIFALLGSPSVPARFRCLRRELQSTGVFIASGACYLIIYETYPPRSRLASAGSGRCADSDQGVGSEEAGSAETGAHFQCVQVRRAAGEAERRECGSRGVRRLDARALSAGVAHDGAWTGTGAACAASPCT